MTTIDITPDTLVSDTVAAAAAAFARTRLSSDRTRAVWLRTIADRLDGHRAELVAIAMEESRLPEARLVGEVARTTGQLRLFAGVLEDGAYLEATIDHAVPTATPPTPDLRRMLRPLGPVAVYSASNFPFAFSVAGGDTASALAAGCPVVVKGHSAHPRLSVRTAELVVEALEAAGAPAGTFGHVAGREAGVQLVQAPAIRAAGFTGSLGGGRALFDLAVGRPDPIPFYGELSAVNPVLVTAAALEARGADLAAGLAASFTGSAGQLCTKPGVVFVPRGSDFGSLVADAAGSVTPAPMLTEGIARSFRERAAAIVARSDIEVLLGGLDAQSDTAGSPIVARTSVAAVLAAPDVLLEEAFGPLTLLVEYERIDEVLAAVRALGGSLTATIHAEPSDDIAEIVDTFAEIAGRVLFDGWPTGVAVDWAQQHGGPWPSTTSSMHTSVGATAIRRWLRPVAYQSAPEPALPEALREANPLDIPRRVDGVLTLPASA